MKQFRESNLNSSVTTKETTDYTIPQPWAFVKTPNTPLEACLTPNPSSSLRKQCAYWLQQIPDKGSPKSNKSTVSISTALTNDHNKFYLLHKYILA